MQKENAHIQHGDGDSVDATHTASTLHRIDYTEPIRTSIITPTLEHIKPVGVVIEPIEPLTIDDIYGTRITLIQRIQIALAFLNTHIIKGFIMRDWKTTLTGVVKALFVIAGVFSIQVPDVVQQQVVQFVGIGYALFEAIQGWVSKDKEKS
jgi:hypothetical protein